MSHQAPEVDLLAVINAVSRKKLRLGFEGLNEAERVVFLTGNTPAEIAINGLFGYYENSSGDHAAEAVAAFHAIGAPQVAEVLLAANRAFPGGSPDPDPGARWDQLMALLDRDDRLLEELEARYREAEREIAEPLERYVLVHLDELPKDEDRGPGAVRPQ